MSPVQPKASLFDRQKYSHRTEPVKVQVEDDPTGMSVETIDYDLEMVLDSCIEMFSLQCLEKHSR